MVHDLNTNEIIIYCDRSIPNFIDPGADSNSGKIDSQILIPIPIPNYR